MSVEAKPGFKPQRIARAQADRQHFWLLQQLARQALRLIAGDRNLEAILAGVARAGQEGGDAVEFEEAAGHEGQRRHRRIQARQRRDRQRALQRQQRPLGHRNHLALAADAGLQISDVGDLAAGVDDDEQVVRPARNHQIVEDAACFIGEQGVTLLEHAKVDHIDRHQRFERG